MLLRRPPYCEELGGEKENITGVARKSTGVHQNQDVRVSMSSGNGAVSQKQGRILKRSSAFNSAAALSVSVVVVVSSLSSFIKTRCDRVYFQCAKRKRMNISFGIKSRKGEGFAVPRKFAIIIPSICS